MNKIYNPQPENWSEILKRPTQTFTDVEETVKQIFKEVQEKGDTAVAKYTNLFDGIEIKNILVTNEEIEKAKKEVLEVRYWIDRRARELSLRFMYSLDVKSADFSFDIEDFNLNISKIIIFQTLCCGFKSLPSRLFIRVTITWW